MTVVRKVNENDLSLDEQEHVRNALHYLRLRFGGWEPLGRTLRYEPTSLIHVAKGRRTASPTLAFRVARLVKVKVDDLVAGKFPSTNACPRCGYDPHARGTS